MCVCVCTVHCPVITSQKFASVNEKHRGSSAKSYCFQVGIKPISGCCCSDPSFWTTWRGRRRQNLQFIGKNWQYLTYQFSFSSINRISRIFCSEIYLQACKPYSRTVCWLKWYDSNLRTGFLEMLYIWLFQYFIIHLKAVLGLFVLNGSRCICKNSKSVCNSATTKSLIGRDRWSL